MKFLFLILLFVSCASRIPLRKDIQSLPKTSIKENPVHSREEALSFIQNRQNFLKLLFENNEAPVYVEKKWTAQCLSENKIGSIHEKGNQISLISELYLDPSNHEGFCSDKFYAHKAYVIYVYCEEISSVLDIRFQYDEKFMLDQRNLCL